MRWCSENAFHFSFGDSSECRGLVFQAWDGLIQSLTQVKKEGFCSVERQFFSKQSAGLCPESERAAFEASMEAARNKLRPLCRALLLRSVGFQEAFKPPRKGSACGLQRTECLSSGRNKATASVPHRSLATKASAPFLTFIGDERNVLYILIFM